MFVSSVVAVLAALAWAAEAPKEEGFTELFDGKTLNGWRRCNEPGHGWGAVWSARDGALDGVQEWPGAWGMVATAKTFGDFELRLEVKTDWPLDAGVMLRSGLDGRAYQVLVHSRPDGDVGGIAGSRIGDFSAPAKGWKKLWKKADWNELRIVIKGNPPEIHTWLNGAPVADFKDDAKEPRLPATGHIALKVHGDEGCFNNHVAVRHIRVLELK